MSTKRRIITKTGRLRERGFSIAFATTGRLPMLKKTQSQPDLLLLLSLLLVILMQPVLDHGVIRRLILGGLMFVPPLIATVRLSEIKGWVWPALLLMAVAFGFAAASTFYPSRTLVGIKWGLLAAFFATHCCRPLPLSQECSLCYR